MPTFEFNPFTGNPDITSKYAGATGTAPVGRGNGFMTVVDGVLWYFAGGNRYKLTATLDNPVTTFGFVLLEDGASIMLLEDGTSKLGMEA